MTSDYGMVMPKGVPEPIRAKLEKALGDTLQDKGVQTTMSIHGFPPPLHSGQRFRGHG